MTDQELLELAAKAAGINYFIDGDAIVERFPDGHAEWNPLQDDVDAMQLLVTLRLSIESNASIELAFWDGVYGEYELGVEVWLVTESGKVIRAWELYHQDPEAATRRAIVECAAKIGKEMK